MPLLILLLILPELLTIAFILLDVYLFHEWYVWRNTYHHNYAMHNLYWGIALAAYSLVGKTPVSYLVSKSRKGELDPNMQRSEKSEKLQRPDGTVIHIEFMGDPDAKPILFVHGWNENSTAWFYQKKQFAQTNRVILIDLPGLGKSKGPDNKDYSLPKMARDLEAVIEHLNLNSVVLWGHSIGGMVILTYLTQIGKNIPQLIKGVILQHTTFTNPTKTSILSGLLTTIKKPVLYPICYLMIGLWPVLWLSKWMSYLNGNMLLSTRFSTFAGTQTHAQLDFISRLSAMARPNVFARGMLGMMKTYDVTNDLVKLNVPTLIFGAEYDRLTKPVAAGFMSERIPFAELVLLSPAGHQGLIERNVETNAAAAKFITSLTKSQRVTKGNNMAVKNGNL